MALQVVPDLFVVAEHLPYVRCARRCPLAQLWVHQQVLSLLVDQQHLVEVAEYFPHIGGAVSVPGAGGTHQAGCLVVGPEQETVDPLHTGGRCGQNRSRRQGRRGFAGMHGEEISHGWPPWENLAGPAGAGGGASGLGPD